MKRFTSQLAIIMGFINLYPLQAYADSPKVYLEVIGHYYQRFDTNGTWPNAKLACESKQGHLATITSATEEYFIEQVVLKGANGYYFIGGTDATVQTQWQWLTGEKWSYQLWAQSGDNGQQPNGRIDEDYLLIGINHPNTEIAWFDVNSSLSETGYICEWGFNSNIGTIALPDLNKNGTKELAVLQVAYPSGKHIVTIKDTKTKKVINTLTFAINHEPPQDVAVINDLNKDGSPEIAVLYNNNSQPAVFIKGANAKTTDGFLKIINFFNKSYNPQAMAVVNNKGTDAITVLARHKQTQADVTETRDSATTKLINRTHF
jgi:Lectin C-type domain